MEQCHLQHNSIYVFNLSKNGKKYSFKRHWQNQIDDDITKIIKMKNSKVYFGKYKDYKKFNKELDRKIVQELLMSGKDLNKLKKEEKKLNLNDFV